MAKEGEKGLGMARQLRATEGKERQKGIMKPEIPNSLEIFKELYRIGRTNLPHQFRNAE